MNRYIIQFDDNKVFNVDLNHVSTILPIRRIKNDDEDYWHRDRRSLNERILPVVIMGTRFDVHIPMDDMTHDAFVSMSDSPTKPLTSEKAVTIIQTYLDKCESIRDEMIQRWKQVADKS